MLSVRGGVKVMTTWLELSSGVNEKIDETLTNEGNARESG